MGRRPGPGVFLQPARPSAFRSRGPPGQRSVSDALNGQCEQCDSTGVAITSPIRRRSTGSHTVPGSACGGGARSASPDPPTALPRPDKRPTGLHEIPGKSMAWEDAPAATVWARRRMTVLLQRSHTAKRPRMGNCCLMGGGFHVGHRR